MKKKTASKGNKKKKKVLFIQLDKPVTEAVAEYCNEASIKIEDLSFALGYLTGKVNDTEEGQKQLYLLLQSYFFAGVFHGKTKDFTFKYLSKQKRDEKSTEAENKMLELLQKKKPIPSYMG
jgi:hypothetical protein